MSEIFAALISEAVRGYVRAVARGDFASAERFAVVAFFLAEQAQGVSR